MASQLRCPVCYLPVDEERGGAAALWDHLVGHAERQGRGEDWVEEQYRKVYPDGDIAKEDGDT
jgi:hypothetical protein